jgi:hypothetical protein
LIFILILFKKDEPIVGSGVKSPVYINMTSKKLLRNIEYDGIHHIDGTYKITHFGYPLLVYGVSDRCGHFHPVCFSIVSGETTDDFKHFYQGLINICEQLKLNFKPELLMQDAQKAARAAVLEYFKDVKILMCYFHVKKNVKYLFIN